MNKWNKFLTEGELKTVGIVACLNDKQQFLVIRRSNIDERAGQWTMPGGHIDDKDGSIEAGAARELKEEADLTCKVSDLVRRGLVQRQGSIGPKSLPTGLSLNDNIAHIGELRWRWHRHRGSCNIARGWNLNRFLHFSENCRV